MDKIFSKSCIEHIIEWNIYMVVGKVSPKSARNKIPKVDVHMATKTPERSSKIIYFEVCLCYVQQRGKISILKTYI